jgi:hypothetical protein
LGQSFKDARKAYETDLKHGTIIEKTADLFMRLDTKQAEVVATVLFAAQALQEREKTRPSESDVLKAVMDWKQRRRPPLEEPEVALTVRNLAALKWLQVTPSSNLPLPDETGLDI